MLSGGWADHHRPVWAEHCTCGLIEHVLIDFSLENFPLYGMYMYCFPTRPQVMLGVTNPFFAKALEHWPHIIRLADITNSSEDAYATPSAGSGRSRSPGDGSDSRPGIQTKYKPFLNRDKAFAKIISTSKVRESVCVCVWACTCI